MASKIEEEIGRHLSFLQKNVLKNPIDWNIVSEVISRILPDVSDSESNLRHLEKALRHDEFKDDWSTSLYEIRLEYFQICAEVSKNWEKAARLRDGRLECLNETLTEQKLVNSYEANIRRFDSLLDRLFRLKSSSDSDDVDLSFVERQIFAALSGAEFAKSLSSLHQEDTEKSSLESKVILEIIKDSFTVSEVLAKVISADIRSTDLNECIEKYGVIICKLDSLKGTDDVLEQKRFLNNRINADLETAEHLLKKCRGEMSLKYMDAAMFFNQLLGKMSAKSNSSSTLLNITFSHITEVTLENDKDQKLARQTLLLLNQFIAARKMDWSIFQMLELWKVYFRTNLKTFVETLYFIRNLNLKPIDQRKDENETHVSLLKTLENVTIQNVKSVLSKYKQEDDIGYQSILSEIELSEIEKRLIVSVVSKCKKILCIPRENSETCKLIEDLKRLVKDDKCDFSNKNLLQNALHLVCLAIQSSTNQLPRETQMVSFCIIMIGKEKGRLLEVSTGEGKSYIIAMVAGITALMGLQVDVVTSSEILAIRDSEEWKQFYNILGLKVCYIEDYDSKAFKSDIIYGVVSSFSGYILRTEFQKQSLRHKSSDIVIVDEVDSMLIDEGMTTTYLSHNDAVTGLHHLEPVMALVWSSVSRNSPTIDGEGNVHFLSSSMPFFMAAFHIANASKVEIKIIELLQIAFNLKFIPQTLVEKWDTEEAIDELQKALLNISRSDMETFFNELKLYKVFHDKGVSFQIYGLDSNRRLLPSDDFNEDGIPIVIGNNGLAFLIQTKENLCQEISEELQEKIQIKNESGEDGSKVGLPKFLQEFTSNNLKKWINNAFEALEMSENRNYIKKDGRIYPVDFRSTGVVQLNRHWAGGIQQFLEMKHRLSLSNITLITNFLSNIKFFQRYSKLHGVSGTLGSKADRMFMTDMYNVEFLKIPTNKRCKMFQIQNIMCNTEKEWKMSIFQQIKSEILPTSFRGGRSALVLCSDIETAESFKNLIEKEGLGLKVNLYVRSDCDEQKKVVEQIIEPNTVIVATNLAGRGTDIKVDEKVSSAGGLFVLSTFLPKNTRVERQAFGRTARKGEPGSVQIVLNGENHPGIESVEKAKEERNNQEIQNMKRMKETQVKTVLLKEKLFEIYCQSIDNRKHEFESESSIILNSLHESWAIWLEEKSDRIRDANDFEENHLEQQLRDHLCTTVQKVKIGESPNDNFYHLTKLGSNKIDSDTDKALNLFTRAINLDPKFAMIAYYKRAQCYLKRREPSNYLDCAISDLNQMSETAKLSKNEVLNTKIFVESSGKSPSSNEADFSHYIEAKCQILELLENNVAESVLECQRLKDQKKKAKVENKSLKLPGSNAFQNAVVEQYSEMGLSILFTVKEKWTLCWSAVAALGIGILEVAGGLILITTSWGLFSKFGLDLIMEGISDCFAAVKGLINASWDWAAWGISKAITIVISIACFAISSLCKPGSLKALKDAVKHPIKTAKVGLNSAKKGLAQAGSALKNIPKVLKGEVTRKGCSQALNSQLKNAGVCIMKEAVSQGIMMGVDKLEQLVVEELKDVLGHEIKPAIAKGLDFKRGQVFDEVSFLYNFHITSVDGCNSEEKLLQSINQCARKVIHDLISTSQVKELLMTSFGVVLNKVRGNQNVDKKVKTVLKMAQWTVNAISVSEALYTVTKATVKFESDLASSLQKERPPNAPQNQQTNQVSQTFLSKLQDSIAELLYDAFASIIHQKVLNLAIAECNVKIGNCIRKNKFLDQSKNIETLQKGGQAFNIAYGKSSKYDKTSKAAVNFHSEEILNENSPGGLLDLRVLSDENDCKVEIYTKDSDGNLKLLRGIGSGSKNVVKLLYTEPAMNSNQGHYDAIIDGKVVKVHTDKNSCLFKAFAKGHNPHSTDINSDAKRLRKKVSERLQLDPQGYAKISDQFEKLKLLDPKLAAIGGIAKKLPPDYDCQSSEYEDNNMFEFDTYSNLKDKTEDGTNYNIDHMPPYACVKNAADSDLRKALMGPNGLNSRGRGLPACRTYAEFHKFYLSTGNSKEAQQFREMVTQAISEERLEDMIKFTIIGSTPALDQRQFCKGNERRKAGQPQPFVENNQTRFQKKQKEALLRYPDLLYRKLNPQNMMTTEQRDDLKSWIRDEGYRDPNDSHFKKLYDACENARRKN